MLAYFICLAVVYITSILLPLCFVVASLRLPDLHQGLPHVLAILRAIQARDIFLIILLLETLLLPSVFVVAQLLMVTVMLSRVYQMAIVSLLTGKIGPNDDGDNEVDMAAVEKFRSEIKKRRRNAGRRRQPRTRERSDRPEIAEMKARMTRAAEASTKYLKHIVPACSGDNDDVEAFCKFEKRFPKKKRQAAKTERRRSSRFKSQKEVAERPEIYDMKDRMQRATMAAVKFTEDLPNHPMPKKVITTTANHPTYHPKAKPKKTSMLVQLQKRLHAFKHLGQGEPSVGVYVDDYDDTGKVRIPKTKSSGQSKTQNRQSKPTSAVVDELSTVATKPIRSSSILPIEPSQKPPGSKNDPKPPGDLLSSFSTTATNAEPSPQPLTSSTDHPKAENQSNMYSLLQKGLHAFNLGQGKPSVDVCVDDDDIGKVRTPKKKKHAGQSKTQNRQFKPIPAVDEQNSMTTKPIRSYSFLPIEPAQKPPNSNNGPKPSGDLLSMLSSFTTTTATKVHKPLPLYPSPPKKDSEPTKMEPSPLRLTSNKHSTYNDNKTKLCGFQSCTLITRRSKVHQSRLNRAFAMIEFKLAIDNSQEIMKSINTLMRKNVKTNVETKMAKKKLVLKLTDRRRLAAIGERL